MGSIDEFIKWAKKETYRRGLVCHFYIAQSTKQYYDKTDYAYFNLFCDSRDWVVKGTPGHGIRSQRRKKSPIPCLNCFEVNDEFYKAIKKINFEGIDKFELGIILNKRMVKKDFNVIDVSNEFPEEIPPPNKCHYYDNPRFKKGVLHPFNYCDVVRIEIPKSDFHEIPIATIQHRAIAGMLVKKKDSHAIRNTLKSKNIDKINVFPIL